MIPIIPNCHTCEHFFYGDDDGEYICDCDCGYVPDKASLDDPCDLYKIDIDYIVRQLEILKWWGFDGRRHSCDDCIHSCTGRDPSTGCEDWACAMESNPCLPFTIDDGHPCPLWEGME